MPRPSEENQKPSPSEALAGQIAPSLPLAGHRLSLHAPSLVGTARCAVRAPTSDVGAQRTGQTGHLVQVVPPRSCAPLLRARAGGAGTSQRDVPAKFKHSAWLRPDQAPMRGVSYETRRHRNLFAKRTHFGDFRKIHKRFYSNMLYKNKCRNSLQ